MDSADVAPGTLRARPKRPRSYIVPTVAALAVLIVIGTFMSIRANERQEMNRLLFDAVDARDVSGVRSLLRKGADPNARRGRIDRGGVWIRLSRIFGPSESGTPLIHDADDNVQFYKQVLDVYRQTQRKRNASKGSSKDEGAAPLEERIRDAEAIVALLKQAGAKD